jgi:hypothetical protein
LRHAIILEKALTKGERNLTCFLTLLDLTKAIMPQSCFACKVVASKDVTLFCCGKCRSALYCSRVCQRIDWKQHGHKQICESLNVGEGAMQVWHSDYGERYTELKERFELEERNFGKEGERFFKHFIQSTFEGSQAAARNMKKIAMRHSKHNRKCFLFHSLYLLIHTASEKLIWPNSPLLVLLPFVDPNVLAGPDRGALQGRENSGTLLHKLARMADATSSDYSTQENQLILGRQLIKLGANVNGLTYPEGVTPLHLACHSATTTNLDFIQLLLDNGADPNIQDVNGKTPIMNTLRLAPGAAKYLLEWPTTDVNLTANLGYSFLAMVRAAVRFLQGQVVLARPHQVQDQFLLLQWLEIEKMLVEREAVDAGIVEA